MKQRLKGTLVQRGEAFYYTPKPCDVWGLKRRITQEIIDYYDELAPGWNYLPDDERQQLALVLRQLAKDLRLKRGQMVDRAGLL